MSRGFWVVIHRWAGLTMTIFLVIVGLTGSLLAFYPELERLLNPLWYPDRPASSWLSAGELAARLEVAEPRLRVGEVSLQSFNGASSASVQARNNPADSKPFKLGYNNVILDPTSGEALDRIEYGAISEGWKNLMDFVYELHWTLALGDVGVWALGICALIWTLDCFIGFYLTLPSGRRASPDAHVSPTKTWRQRWKPAWKIRLFARSYKLNFDLHRAGGLWLWLALLVFAWSAVYMNLWDTVYTWSTRAVMDFRPQWVLFQPLPTPIETPRLGWREAQQRADELMANEAKQHGFVIERPVGLRYYPAWGVYQYQVLTNREIDDRPRRYGTQIYIDATTGALRAAQFPSGQYAGNTVTNWLYALHMANVFGLPYRIFVCLLGVAIAMLAITGVYIWWKKRQARVRQAMHRIQAR